MADVKLEKGMRVVVKLRGRAPVRGMVKYTPRPYNTATVVVVLDQTYAPRQFAQRCVSPEPGA